MHRRGEQLDPPRRERAPQAIRTVPSMMPEAHRGAARDRGRRAEPYARENLRPATGAPATLASDETRMYSPETEPLSLCAKSRSGRLAIPATHEAEQYTALPLHYQEC